MSTRAPGSDDWDLILSRIRSERCVPFLGAGASLGYGEGPGLPTAGELAQALAEECKYPGIDKRDFLRVAQYYMTVRDPHAVRESVSKKLLVKNARPSAVQKALASLPFRYVITTNFDKLMERAFEEEGKRPQVGVYECRGDCQDLRPGTKEEPLVYKIHGSFDRLETMILTEDDTIDFLCSLMAGDPPLPSVIRQLFEGHSMLFVGYGLKDWDIRVLLRNIRGRRRGGAKDLLWFGIQRRPSEDKLAREWEASIMYWEKTENLRVFDTDAVQFTSELEQRYKAGEG